MVKDRELEMERTCEKLQSSRVFFFLVSKSSNAYMKWSLNYNFLRKEEIKGQLMTNATVLGMKSIQSAILVTIFWNFSMF